MNRRTQYKYWRHISDCNNHGNYGGYQNHDGHRNNNQIPGGNSNNPKNYNNGGQSMISKINIRDKIDGKWLIMGGRNEQK